MSPATLEYSKIPENRADRTYAILLTLLALIYTGSTMTMLFAARMPVKPPETPMAIKWVFHLSAAICGFVTLLTVITLIARARNRSNGCLVWTKAFNIFLLIVFPIGTAVGIYGLWKLDKVPGGSETGTDLEVKQGRI